MYKVSLYHYRNGFEQDFPTAASRVLYDDTKLDGIRTIFEPVVKNSITEIPSFEFSILPNHPLYDELVKFSTIITVQRNSTVLFYGRVMHDGIDFYGQRKVSCEGALGFLLDTVISPKDTGSVTPKAFLTTLINEHNNVIVNGESYKRFTIGTVTASKVKDGTEYTVDNSHLAKKFKTDSYTQTKSVIESQLINEFKGFLFARYEGGTLYLDWLKSIGRTNNQPVKMAVNMLDRTFEENTDDYYTVLFPIGEKKVTIASANNGNKYLEDSTAIAKHGRIIKVETFSDCKTASALLTKAREEFAKRGTNLPTSWHIKAVDMSLLGNNVTEILTGDHLTKLEDRDGSFISNVTVVEATYNLLDPSQDEYVVENQEAIDQRNNSDRGNGTLSGRTGGISGAFDGDSMDFRKNYNTYQLTVNDWYDLTANTITERSQQHNIITGVLNALFDDGYFDSFTGNNVKEVTITNPDGSKETAWVQAMTGSRVHQDPSGITSYVQDISGIRTNRIETLDPKDMPQGADKAEAFSESKAYAVGDFCYVESNNKRTYYRFTKAHSPGAWNASDVEVLTGGKSYIYEPIYKTDSQGNTYYDLVTGEAVYATINDSDENKVHIPLRTIAKQTQSEFYQVVGTTDISRVMNLPDGAEGAEDFSASKSYSVGDYCYYTVDGERILYRFTSAHSGSWNPSHVVAIDMQTIQKMTGSTLWQKEHEIVNVVGEVEVTSIVPPEASQATAFSENVTYSAGDYVWYPPTGKDRGLYKFTKSHRAGPWLGTDVKQITTKTVVIKNGTGLQVVDNGSALAIFKNGKIDAGFIINSLNNGETEAKIKASRVDITSTSGSGISIDQNGNININVNDLVNNINTNASLNINAARINLTSGAVIKAINGGQAGDSSLTIDVDKLNLTSGAVIKAINGGGSGASQLTIDADKLNVTGLVTSEQLETAIAAIDTIVGDLNVMGALTIGGNAYAEAIYIPEADGENHTVTSRYWVENYVQDALSNLRITGPTNNVYTLEKQTYGSDSWTAVGSFSRATSLSGLWSGGAYTVTATPQNETDVTALTVTGHWGNVSNNESATTYYGDIKATRNSSQTIYNTGKTFSVDASNLVGVNPITYESTENPRDFDNWTGTNVGILASDTYYRIKANPKFGAADYIKFKTPVSTEGTGGIASITAGGWTYVDYQYKNVVTAVPNDGSDPVTAEVTLPTISSLATITYNATSHKYTAYSTTKVYSTEWASDSLEGDTQAYEDGQDSIGVTIDVNNKTVKKSVGGSNAVAISAVASISYNASTHKYTAYSTAKAANTEMDSDDAESGTQAYEAGWASAYGKVTLPSAMTTTSNNLVTVYTPPQTVDGTRVGTNLYLVCNDNYAYIRSVNSDSGGVTYARITNPKTGGQGGVQTAALNAYADESEDIESWTWDTGINLSHRYNLVLVTAKDGSTYTVELNASGVYNAGYNAAPVGLLHTTDLLTWSASSNDEATYTGWAYTDSISTGGYKYRQYYVTAANGDTAYIKVNASTTYQAGYDAAPVGLASDIVVYRSGESTNSEDTYNGWTGHSDTINMSTYKYRRYDVCAADGTSKIIRIHAEGVYDAGYDAGEAAGKKAVTVSIDNYKNSTNSKDYDDWTGTAIGTLAAGTYYQFRAAGSNNKYAYAKFKTPASSSGVSASAIDLYVLGTTETKPTTSTHPGYTSIVQMNTLIGLIDLYKNSSKTKYIPFEAKLTSGGTGNKKLYYISVGGSSD